MRILLVEDDATIREALGLGLTRKGFEVDSSSDGPAGLAAFFAERPDLVVLDLGLPVMDGIDVCRAIRAVSTTPIVMLTARSDTEDVVAGLQAGADDYVVKPFEMRELIARLQAVHRRASREPQEDRLTVGELTIDFAAAEVIRTGQRVPLTPTEYKLLVELARHRGIVRSRDDLLAGVWDYSWSGDTRLVDVHVQRLRAKIGSDVIDTVRGLGYRMRSR